LYHHNTPEEKSKVACLFKGRRSIETYKEKESGIENLAVNLHISTVSDPKSNSHKVSFAAFKLISNPHSPIRKLKRVLRSQGCMGLGCQDGHIVL